MNLPREFKLATSSDASCGKAKEISVLFVCTEYTHPASQAVVFILSREAAFYLAREAGAAVFGLNGSPVGRSLWGKPGWGGFEPAWGGAPIEAVFMVK